MAGIQNIPTVRPEICLAEVKILKLKTKKNETEGETGFVAKTENA